jgi:hypothetical protein
MNDAENKNIISADLLSEIKNVAENLKVESSDLYEKLREFFLHVSREISEFQKLMQPYMDYFYPDDADTQGQTFMTEIIKPSKEEMTSAVDKTIENMSDDKEVNNNVVQALHDVLLLQEKVDAILNIVEDIELYFLNTMIVSIKTGSEGESLTQLSMQMGKLSQVISTTTIDFREMIKKLDSQCNQFDKKRSEIENIHEMYLTEMKITTRMVFDELEEELQLVTAEIRLILNSFNDILKVIDEIVSQLQMEDLLRQDAEKIIFFIEFINTGAGELKRSLKGKIESGRLTDAFISLLSFKLDRIYHNLSSLGESMNISFENIQDASESVLNALQGDETMGSRNLEDIYHEVEKMESSFIENISEIIGGKKQLYMNSQEIMGIITKFNDFFAVIIDVAKKFEIINLLTRIELARSSRIMKTIGGALLNISKLPAEIKHNIEDSLKQYDYVKDNISHAIDRYLLTFNEQEEILNTCVIDMEIVSTKLRDSRDYYHNISSEINTKSQDVMVFTKTVKGEYEEFNSIKQSIESVFNKTRKTLAGIKGSEYYNTVNFKNELKIIQQYFVKNAESGDYKMIMMRSLLNESIDVIKDESVTFF